MKLNRTFLTLLLYYWCILLCAQPSCTITQYDEFNGLSQWYVTQIVQDKQGMMWFATWNGLNRYDGYGFDCFKSEAGDGIDIPSDRIMDLILDKKGNLLCLIDDHVFLFDTKSCKYHNVPKKQEQELVEMFAKRKKWIESHYSMPFNFKDKYGTQWYIDTDGSISYKDNATNKLTPYTHLNLKMKAEMYCTTDYNGNVWLCGQYGAYKLSFHKQPFTRFPQETTSQIRCLYYDKKQRYWVTGKNDCTVRLFDKNNNLLGYLGADGHLNKNFTSFSHPVYTVFQDSKGVFWFGTKPDGLFRGTEHEDGTFSFEQYKHDDNDVKSISNDEIYDIKEDIYHRLWVATFSGGINCIPSPHEKELTFINDITGLRYPKDKWLRARHIHINSDNIMFVATTQGLLVGDVSSKDEKKIVFKLHKKEYNRENSLSNNATMYVTEDDDHNIYVCTESGGVNMITSKDYLSDELDFMHLNRSSGLPSDVALSAKVAGGKMVVVSNNQIIFLTLPIKETLSYEPFLWQEHLRFSDATPLFLSDGSIIFGLQDGAIVVRNEDIKRNHFAPPIALTALSIENGAPNHAINSLDTLVLSPPSRDITIWFSALDYSPIKNIKYSFRLGENQPWNNIDENHSVTFLDLAPGKYNLQIRSTNSNGVWVDNIRSLIIVVKPKFMETIWAKLLFAILIGLFIWGVVHTWQYINNLKRRQKELLEEYLELVNAQQTSLGNTSTTNNYSVAQPVIHTVSQVTSPTHNMKPEDEDFMRRVMNFIENHLGDADVNISDMANATATSYSGLNRKMKSLLGVTPLDFLREARIRKACQLLSEGLSVNTVAMNCGFADAKYFGKCFKAETGMTPTEFKAKKNA